jgi:hypothetical protein
MRIKGSGKVQSPLQKSMYASYFQWIKTLKGYDIHITGLDYMALWEANMPKWEGRGRKAGEYYLAVIDPTKPVTLKNVAITTREVHANSEPKLSKPKVEEVQNETFHRKFKSEELQRKFDAAVQTKRSNYKSFNLIKQRERMSKKSLS